MANQWFDSRPPITQRAGDLLRGMVFRFARPLDALGINTGLLDLPDIGRRVIAFVRANLFENPRAEDGRMFGDSGPQTLFVVHPDIGTGEGDEEIAANPPQLEDAPKLVFLSDFALPDTRHLETVERQEFVGLDGMGADEMSHVQPVPPPMACESIHGLAYVPGQGTNHLGAHGEQKG